MNLQRGVCIVLGVLLLSLSLSSAGDIVHHDDVAPKRPGCENNFVLVNLTLYFLNFIEFSFDFSLLRLNLSLCLESDCQSVSQF